MPEVLAPASNTEGAANIRNLRIVARCNEPDEMLASSHQRFIHLTSDAGIPIEIRCLDTVGPARSAAAAPRQSAQVTGPARGHAGGPQVQRILDAVRDSDPSLPRVSRYLQVPGRARGPIRRIPSA